MSLVTRPSPQILDAMVNNAIEHAKNPTNETVSEIYESYRSLVPEYQMLLLAKASNESDLTEDERKIIHKRVQDF